MDSQAQTQGHVKASHEETGSCIPKGNHHYVICLRNYSSSHSTKSSSPAVSMSVPTPSTTEGPMPACSNTTAKSTKPTILLLHHELNEFVVYENVSWETWRIRTGKFLQSIRPSPSWSASLIISSTSSSVNFSPMDVMTWRSSAAEMKPLLSRSKTYQGTVSTQPSI